MTTFDRKLIDFITKHKYLIGFIIVTIAALVVRYAMRNFKSEDYNIFLLPWFEQLKAGGGLRAIGDYVGDYNAPYVTIMALLTYLPFNPLHLIKAVSIAGDFLLAIASVLLVRQIVKTPKSKNLLSFIIYTLILFLPTVVLNAATWAQCDALYTSFIIFSLYFLFKNKYSRSFIFLGIAFALKLQTIFILPVYLILYLTQKRFSILQFLWVPAMHVLLSIPALIFGWAPEKLITTYLGQTSATNTLSFNFPNLWTLLPFKSDEPAHMMVIYGVALGAIAIGLMIFFCLSRKIKWDAQKILLLAFWCIITLTFLFPKMHERYLFSAEIIGLIIVVVYHQLLLQEIFFLVCAIRNYATFLLRNEDVSITVLPLALQAIIYAFVLGVTTHYLVALLADEDHPSGLLSLNSKHQNG